VDPIASSIFSTKISLPTIDTVFLGPYNEFLISHCPNLTTISSNGLIFLHSTRSRHYNTRQHLHHPDRLMSAAATATKLEHFSMDDWWSIAKLQGTTPPFKTSLSSQPVIKPPNNKK